MSFQINFNQTSPAPTIAGLPEDYVADSNLAGLPLGGLGDTSLPVVDPDIPEYELMATQPSDSFTTTAPYTEVIVNGVDYSGSLSTMDWASFLNGASQGVLTFRCETMASVRTGHVVNVKYIWDDGESQVLKAFVLEPPRRSGFSPTPTWTLRVGDVFTWSATKKPDTTIYCGPMPTTAGGLVGLYATQRNLKHPDGSSIVLPDGVTLPAGDFYRPDIGFWEFASGLFAPLGFDIGTDNYGVVVVRRRPTLATSGSVTIDRFMDLERDYTAVPVYSKVQVRSEYNVNQGFTREETVTERLINPGSTDRPWFLGGRMSIKTTSVNFGNSLVYRKEETFGQIPNSPTGSVPVAEDGCEPVPIATSYGLISTKTYALAYQDIGLAAFLVTGWREFTTGLLAKVENNAYVVTSGPISERYQEYTNVAQVATEVCPKDYIYVQARVVSAEYGIKEVEGGPRVLQQIKGTVETYTVDVEGPTGNVGYAGLTRSWLRTTIESERTSDGYWFTQPATRDDTEPGLSKWVGPKIASYVVETEVSLPALANQWGISTAPNISTTTCFTLDTAEHFGSRWMLEQAGLNAGVTIVGPFWTPAANGAKVRLTTNLGGGAQFTGFCYATEINQSAGQVTKTLTLLKLFA